MTKLIDLTGQVIGRWTVLRRGETKPSGQTTWICRCECGNEGSVQGAALRSAWSRSCGCLVSDTTRTRSTKHGHANAGALTPTYHSWTGMVGRCTNPKNDRWPDYGGRGIKVCERWLVFANFLADMGVKPAGTSIEREQNTMGYEPGNCRWASPKEQARNKRSNAVIEVAGITRTKAEWAERAGISVSTLDARLLSGWDPAEAVTAAKRHCRGPDRKPRGPLSQKHPKAKRV